MGSSVQLKIAVLPGDGIGPEVTREALRVLRRVAELNDYRIEFSEHRAGGVAIRRDGEPLPPETLNACLAADAVLLGAVGGPEFDKLPPGKKPESGLLALRQALGGFANLRPAVCYEAIADCSPLKKEIVSGVDLLVVRELLGGLYFGSPRGIDKDSALNTMRYSVDEIERIARVAFNEARKRRKKVTSVDKQNVLETSQLWRKVVSRVAEEFTDVKLEHALVDSCAMRLVTSPGSFDVILTENLFGDILSDEASVLTGSLGMLGSATIGGRVDLYEPVHGSAPDIAGKGIANPLGAIASAAMMLRYTAGLEQPAQDIETAIRETLSEGHRTADLVAKGAPYVSTTEMGQIVERKLDEVFDRSCAYHAV